MGGADGTHRGGVNVLGVRYRAGVPISGGGYRRKPGARGDGGEHIRVADASHVVR